MPKKFIYFLIIVFLFSLLISGLVLAAISVGNDLDFGGTYKILNLPTDGYPINAGDAATKAYVDSIAGGAPTGATYITQTSNDTLTAEQALSALSTGYMKVTTGTGVVSSQAVPIPVADGGTGRTSLTSGYVLFGAGTSPVGLDSNLYWDNTNKRLGIGTGTPEWRLHAKDGFDWGSAIGVDATGVTGGRRWTMVSTGGTAAEGQGKLLLKDETAAAGVRLTIDTAGNVGIGTTGPNQKLSVAGTLGILEGGTSPTYYTIFQGGDQTANITYTLPTSQAAAAGYVLTNNGTGTLTWAAGGTVTSVGLSAPAEFVVSGSPVTTSGTLTFSKANQSANLVYAGPTSGAAAAPTFRALVAADIPSLDASKITTGIFGIARGGTNASAFTANQLIRMNSAGTALESSGKTVDDFLSTSTDYGRSGVATDLYEGTTKLSDKYLGKTAKAADSDLLDGFDSSYFLNTSSTAQTKTGNLTLPSLYLNAVGNEGNIYNANIIQGYNDLILYGSSAKNVPIYLEGNPVVINNDTGTGNVGIGTTAPGGHLSVDGRSGANDASLLLTNANNTYNVIRFHHPAGTQVGTIHSFGSAWGASGAWQPNTIVLQGLNASLFADDASGILRFYTGGANERVRIDSTGNVGIGTTGPQAKLHISTDGSNSTAMNSTGILAINSSAPQINFNDTDNNDWAIHVNSNKMYFIRQPWEYSDLVLDGAGNVGIGTPNPGQKLEVESTGHTAIGIDAATGYDPAVVFKENNSYKWELNYSASADKIRLYNSSLARNEMELYDSGGVGIAGNLTVGGGTVTLNNGSSNKIVWGTNGVAAPGANSAGAKLVLYGDGTSASNYMIGIEGSTMWFNTDVQYKWYEDSVLRMTLGTGGNLTVGGLGGSGSAVVKVDSTGKMYRDSSNLILETTGLISSGTGGGDGKRVEINLGYHKVPLWGICYLYDAGDCSSNYRGTIGLGDTAGGTGWRWSQNNQWESWGSGGWQVFTCVESSSDGYVRCTCGADLMNCANAEVWYTSR